MFSLVGWSFVRLTQKSKYAVRALMELALDERDCPLGVAEIARRQRIPERFLEQIFGELRRANIIESRRGAHGGYRFAMPTEEISVLDIVEILDGEIRPARCSAGGVCYIVDAPLCATSKVWDEAREALEAVFGRYSIASLAAAEREGRSAHEPTPASRWPAFRPTLDRLRTHLRGRTGLTTSTVEVDHVTYLIAHPVSADDLIDEQEFDRDERLPYWAELWPSALALARHLSARDLAGIRAIELGCGVGLPTIVALARGATVLATDHYEAALDYTAHNAATNLGREPDTALLDWRTPDIQGLGTFDLVLAADVLYERKNATALAELVPKLLTPGGEALFADPRRDEAPVYLDAMETNGFADAVEEVAVEQGTRKVKVLLHHLRR
jgi:Rrf2 family protein